MSKGKIFYLVVFLCLISPNLYASFSKEFKSDFQSRYTPAEPHKGLETAAEPLDYNKIRTFLVIKLGDLIPAERAFYVISPGEYDYRGAEVVGSKIKTRMGKPYTHLARGTVMALADVVYSGTKVYLKMISLDKIKSDHNAKLKETRVTTMLGFTLPQADIDRRNMQAIYSEVEEWVTPSDSYGEAKRLGQEISYR